MLMKGSVRARCISTRLAVIATAGVLSGCASVPIRAGLSDVQDLVGSRTGLHVHWDQGTPEDAAVVETVQSMLRKPLTADTAVQIALLNNRTLQATFEDLGIARADLVQAGLLSNPVFGGSVDVPKSGSGTHTEFVVVQDVLDLLLLPLRKKLAAEQFEQAKLRVGDAVLNLDAAVRSAYYTLQGAQQMLAMRETVVQAAEAAAELAGRQQEAGNISALDLAHQQAVFHQANLDLVQVEAKVLADRERLRRLMGLSGAEATWEIIEAFPGLPQTEPSLDELEALAVSQRLDLAAARQETRILERAVSLARFGVIPEVAVGGLVEQEPDRPRSAGPTFEFEVPVFDQQLAGLARAKAQLRQSQHRVAAMERQVRSDVRLARERLLAARRAVEYYRDTMIPLHEEIVALSQQHYNYMLLGVYSLLQAKQDEVITRRNSIEALRDYWIARSDLERAVGGRLAVAAATTYAPAEPTTPAHEAPHHHHHGGES